MLLILVKDSHQVFYIESGLKITWILVNLHGAFLLTIKLESREKGIKHLYYRGVSPTTRYVKLEQKLRRGQWDKHRLIYWSLLSCIRVLYVCNV